MSEEIRHLTLLLNALLQGEPLNAYELRNLGLLTGSKKQIDEELETLIRLNRDLDCNKCSSVASFRRLAAYGAYLERICKFRLRPKRHVKK